MKSGHALFVSGLVACGGALAPGGDAGPKASDAAVTDAGSAPGDAAALGPPVGFLTFQHTVGTAQDALFFALFYSSVADTNGSCTVSQQGACKVQTCTSAESTGLISAGTLTITGGVTVAHNSDGSYGAGLPSSFGGGDMLEVSGSGAAIPTFDQNIIAPAEVVLTSPSVTTISTVKDFSVAWSAGEANASVVISIGNAGPPPNNTNYTSATCTFDALAGSASIPQTVLASFKGSQPGTLLIAQQRGVTFTAGAIPLELTAVSASTSAVTFE